MCGEIFSLPSYFMSPSLQAVIGTTAVLILLVGAQVSSWVSTPSCFLLSSEENHVLLWPVGGFATSTGQYLSSSCM